MINTFPLQGVRPNGQCDHEGVQLMPGEMKGGIGGKCDNASLSVRRGKLVGLNADGSVACSGTELVNASFNVRSWVVDPATSTNNELRIVITETKEKYTADGDASPRMVYGMKAAGSSISLCTKGGAQAARQQLFGVKYDQADYSTEDDAAATKQYVLPVVSELYNKRGRPFPAPDDLENDWLQFGCVDDALAKRSLYNLNTDDIEYSRAALQMLIANYCGHLHDTMRGTKIRWSLLDDEDVGSLSPKLEARWSSEGAVCVGKPRSIYTNGSENPKPIDTPKGDLAKVQTAGCTNHKCNTAEDWVNAIRACAPGFNGAPPQAVATCAACTGSDCKKPRLRSYVVKQ